jgi:hypothetical protein
MIKRVVVWWLRMKTPYKEIDMGRFYERETGNGPGSPRQRRQREMKRDEIAKKIEHAIALQGVARVLADILNDPDAFARDLEKS